MVDGERLALQRAERERRDTWNKDYDPMVLPAEDWEYLVVMVPRVGEWKVVAYAGGPAGAEDFAREADKKYGSEALDIRVYKLTEW